MDNEILQITIQPPKKFKTSFGRWWYINVWFAFRHVWISKMKARFYGGIYKLILAILPRDKSEKLREEYNNVEIQIVDESGQEGIAAMLKNHLEEPNLSPQQLEELEKQLAEHFKNY